ncbi:MAG: hypothetical protein KDB90_01575 [Planctomycetes bacterium]|nr:hypothetical protein [Planctomycetota bacterium]
MPRRKTKKVARKQSKPTRLRARSTAMRAIKAGVGVLFAGVVRLMQALTPSGESLSVFFSAAWHSRGVRRCAGLVGGVVVLGLLSWVMLHNLRNDERYRVDPGRIELAASPTWAKGNLAKQLKGDIEEELRADLADLPETNAFDDDLMDTITERIERCPWIRTVIRIERRFPTDPDGYSRLLPVLEIRTPAVVIDLPERYMLVDGEGVVLPLTVPKDPKEYALFCDQLSRPLRMVRGVDGSAPAAGETWSNEQIVAALSMERVIRQAELDRSMPIDAIELVGVPQQADARGRVHYQPDGGVVLIPDQGRMPGARVMWGRPPIHASTLELSPNDKLTELKNRLRAMDSVADARIDLRTRG